MIIYKVVVTVGDQKPAKLSKGDRGMGEVMGQKLSMTVEITDEEGSSPHAHKVNMSIPYNMDGITINIPALCHTCSFFFSCRAINVLH